jgi:hypothetical protein
MASELKFGTPEWRAMYMKPKSRSSAAKSVSIVPATSKSVLIAGGAPKFGTPEWRAKYSKGKSSLSSVSSATKSLTKSLGLGKLETWQLVLLAAGGALVVQHLVAPKGTSVVSKILGGVGVGSHHAGHYVGAVNRGGYRGGAGVPFGPGPWPTQNAAAPDGNMQVPDPARNDPSMMTGCGYGWE